MFVLPVPGLNSKLWAAQKWQESPGEGGTEAALPLGGEPFSGEWERQLSARPGLSSSWTHQGSGSPAPLAGPGLSVGLARMVTGHNVINIRSHGWGFPHIQEFIPA